MKILIAEDDRISAMLVTKLLEPFGSCTLATDGKQAIDRFKEAFNDKQPYQVVFLDIMMPILDGQNVLQQIRDFEMQHELSPSEFCKVIMTSSLGDPENIFEAHVGGCDCFLLKPIDRRKLEEIMTQLLTNGQ